MNKFSYLGLLALLSAPLAQAEGLYAGVSIASPGDNHVTARQDGTLTRYDASREQTQWRFFGGYALDGNWGVETGYRGLGGDTTFQIREGSTLKVRSNVFYAAAKGTWQLDGEWSLFAKAGVAHSRLQLEIDSGAGSANASASRTGAYLSAGASWMVAPNVALQLELERIGKVRYAGADGALEAGMNRLSLGVRYHF